jgi:phage antirepressor YoqD-like protein
MVPGEFLTMSSREIAELVESRHDSVKRTIERLAEKRLVSFTPSVETSHEGAGSRPVEVHLVGKRDSYVVVAQLSPEFTARLVDRWQELEARAAAPVLPNFCDPIAAARAWADAKETEQKALAQVDQQRPAVEFVEKYVEASGSMGFREVCKLLRANENDFRQFLLEAGVMYRLAGRLAPRSPHLDAGRFEVKTGVSAAEHAYTQARFTPKGIAWVAAQWFTRQAAEVAV